MKAIGVGFDFFIPQPWAFFKTGVGFFYKSNSAFTLPSWDTSKQESNPN